MTNLPTSHVSTMPERNILCDTSNNNITDLMSSIACNMQHAISMSIELDEDPPPLSEPPVVHCSIHTTCWGYELPRCQKSTFIGG